ncbi:hypothetical protein F1559_002423 [Cyanidiococcus yangmingshanensis]|uniref:CDC20/Fizzy WD40 domain-containing protein n=1 Tax=Cyanidiococcus yangmingshanensis TaxID=2690220 RepID=A0A7J7IDR7_9RHOD|nr:hypothetical protein F1559_002423 [Cyanidiococcus yangmingshanensis]
MENLDVIEASLGDHAPAPRWKRRQQRQAFGRAQVSVSSEPCSQSVAGGDVRPVHAKLGPLSSQVDQSATASIAGTTVLREHNRSLFLSSPSGISRKRSRSGLPSPAGRGNSPRCDRFIPDRSAMDLEVGRYALTSALGRCGHPYAAREEVLEAPEEHQGAARGTIVDIYPRGYAATASPERAVSNHADGDRLERTAFRGSSPSSVARSSQEALNRIPSWASSLDTLPSLPSTTEELTDEWRTSEPSSPVRMASMEKIHAPGAIDLQQIAQQHEYQNQLAAELGTDGLIDPVTGSDTTDSWTAKGHLEGHDVWHVGGRAAPPTHGHSAGAKILAFKPRPPSRMNEQASHAAIAVVYSQNRLGEACRRHLHRHIPNAPERILDAPEMVDDYYLNLLDWSANNTLAVALGSAVYLWNASTGGIEQLLDLAPSGQNVQQNYVCSVKWVHRDSSGTNGDVSAPIPYLAVGTAHGQVQIWDVEASRRLRTLRTHQGRVGSLDWNGPMLCSGSRDSTVQQHDVRQARHLTATLLAHEQEVCGLQWNPNGTHLASGGNDNLLFVWDSRALQQPRLRFDEHTAAVKALGWCPWQSHLLASGGGTTDRMLRFWNTHTGACLQAIDTESQVCALQWSVHHRELVTGHGFSRNQLIVWKYPNLSKVAELTGHTARVLHLATSPDGQTVVSAAADETLRFWKVFPKPQLSRFGVGKALTAATVRERLVPEDTRLQRANVSATRVAASGSERSVSTARSASLPAVWQSLLGSSSTGLGTENDALEEKGIAEASGTRTLDQDTGRRAPSGSTSLSFLSASASSQVRGSTHYNDTSRGFRTRMHTPTMHSTVIR